MVSQDRSEFRTAPLTCDQSLQTVPLEGAICKYTGKQTVPLEGAICKYTGKQTVPLEGAICKYTGKQTVPLEGAICKYTGKHTHYTHLNCWLKLVKAKFITFKHYYFGIWHATTLYTTYSMYTTA